MTRATQSCRDCTLRGNCEWNLGEGSPVATIPRVYRAGDFIFRQGQKCEGLYVVRSGAVKAFHLGVDGAENVTGFHYPGAVIGIDGLGDDQHATFAQSIDTSSVCCLPREPLIDACSASPKLLRAILKVASQSVVQGMRAYRALGTMTAEQRVANFLLDTSDEQIRRGCSATDIQLPMRRNEVAKHLALAVETLSRTFRRLEDSGVLAVNPEDRHQVSIRSMDKLRAHAA